MVAKLDSRLTGILPGMQTKLTRLTGPDRTRDRALDEPPSARTLLLSDVTALPGRISDAALTAARQVVERFSPQIHGLLSLLDYGAFGPHLDCNFALTPDATVAGRLSELSEAKLLAARTERDAGTSLPGGKDMNGVSTNAISTNSELLSVQGNAVKGNEDTAYLDAQRGIAGVFDGASDLVGFRSPEGLTGGAIASREAARVLKKSTSDQSLLDIALTANAAIDAIQRRFDLDPADKESRFCTTAAMARLRFDETGKKVVDLLQVADSVAVVVYENGAVEVPLGLYDHDEATMRLWSRMVGEGMTGDQIMNDPQMQSQIQAVRRQSNVSYGVLNGEEAVAGLIRHTTLPADGIEKIYLLTDGMFIPKANPSADEDWSVYAKLESQGGMQAILRHVRKLEASDPDLTHYPRFKASDDATGVVLHVNSWKYPADGARGTQDNRI